MNDTQETLFTKKCSTTYQ